MYEVEINEERTTLATTKLQLIFDNDKETRLTKHIKWKDDGGSQKMKT